MKLTERRERFAQLVVELGNKTAAYKEVYSTDNMAAKTINEEACRLAAIPKVSARIDQIRDEVLAESMWKMTDSVQTLISIARHTVEPDSNKEPPRASDVIAAVKEINQMFGWNKKTVDNVSSDGSMATDKGRTLDDFYTDMDKKEEPAE